MWYMIPAKRSLALAPFPWLYLNQTLKGSRSIEHERWTKRKNNHRCSIFAHMRHRLDNQKWAYFLWQKKWEKSIHLFKLKGLLHLQCYIITHSNIIPSIALTSHKYADCLLLAVSCSISPEKWLDCQMLFNMFVC